MRSLAIRLALIAAAAAVLATVLGPSAASSPTVVVAGSARPTVEVIGESLTRQVAPLEVRSLRAQGLVPFVEARDSESLSSSFVQQHVDQAVDDGVPIVVLETAANDAFQGAGTAPPGAWAPALARFEAVLHATLLRLADRCTVLVDTRVQHTAAWYGLSRIGPQIDRALATAAAADPSHVRLVSWSSLSSTHGSDWFWTDGLHFGNPEAADVGWHDAGASAYATAVADAARGCARR